jgi:hypothetical protein
MENALVNILLPFKELTETLPDKRTGKNLSYSMKDIFFSAFSVFFTQSPSFLAAQRAMKEGKGLSNAQTIFGIKEIPSDNHIRTMLDEISPEYIYPMFDKCLEEFQKRKEFESMRGINNTILIALDGTAYHSSSRIHCENCSTKEHKNGTITYHHTAITPIILNPNATFVIPLRPEFIAPQDGHDKQDCENAAAKRWLNKNKDYFQALKTTLLGDDLFSRQSICLAAKEAGFHFIFVCKETSHKSLYEWINVLEKGGDLNIKTLVKGTEKKREIHTYRYANDAPLRDSKDSLIVNWCELTISNEAGKVLNKNAFVTDHRITDTNIEDMILCGRARWKIENENNNTLKTKGYNLSHNFGHGKKYLSSMLATLNILAFLMHTLLEFMDSNYKILRQRLSARKVFFEHFKALTHYLCFKSWVHMLQFMIIGLDNKHNPEDLFEYIYGRF